MKVLIINGSPKKDGVDANIASLMKEEFTGEGHFVEILNVCDMKIGWCLGCMACRKTGVCVQDDDMSAVISEIRDFDILVLMSPIYFGAETGQMKIMLDRFTSAFTEKEPFGKVKVSSVLLTCADTKGAVTYDATLKRIVFEMQCLKVPDCGGYIIGGLSPETVRESSEVRAYINSISEKLGH